MSQYKGKLYVFTSDVDERTIDEVSVLRGAVDHLAQRLAEVASETGAFHPGYPTEDLAEKIRDLCDMIAYREEERKKEEERATEAQP